MNKILNYIAFGFILLIGFAGSYLGYSIYLFVSSGLFFLMIQATYFNKPIVFLKKDFLFLGFIVFGMISNLDNYYLMLQKLVYPWIITLIFQNISISRKQVNQVLVLLTVALIYQVFKMTLYDINGHINLDYTRLVKFSHTEFYLSKGELVPTTYYGTYVALLFLVLFIGYRFNQSFSIIKVLLISIVIILNILAAKRAYWFAILLPSIYIIGHGRKSLKQYYRFALIIVVFITTIIIITPYLKFLDLGELFYRLESFVDSDKANESMSIRYYRWGLALSLILQRPFGVGYTYFFDTYHIGTTHNEYLAVTLGYGIIGLVLYVSIIIEYFNIVLRKLNENNVGYSLRLLGLGTLTFITIIGFTENYSYSNLSFNLYIWVIIGLQGNPLLDIPLKKEYSERQIS